MTLATLTAHTNMLITFNTCMKKKIITTTFAAKSEEKIHRNVNEVKLKLCKIWSFVTSTEQQKRCQTICHKS